jgi:hypothetical protein
MTLVFGKGFEKIIEAQQKVGAVPLAGTQPESSPEPEKTDLQGDPPDSAEERFVANCKQLREVLKLADVGSVRVDFYGSGDSGSFEAPLFDDKYGVTSSPVSTVKIWEEKGYYEFGGTFKGTVELSELPIVDATVKVFEGYVEAQGVDWYNNDGGSGYVKLDVGSGSVEVNIDQNETVSHNAFYTEFDLDGAEV